MYMRPIPGPALRLRGGLGPTQLSRPAVPPAPVTEEVPWLSLGLSGAALLALLPLLLSMPRQAGVTAGAIAVSLLQMAVLDAPPEQALLEGVLALVWSGVITLKEALAGFASEGVVAVGVMSAVAKGVQAGGSRGLRSHAGGHPGRGWPGERRATGRGPAGAAHPHTRTAASFRAGDGRAGLHLALPPRPALVAPRRRAPPRAPSSPLLAAPLPSSPLLSPLLSAPLRSSPLLAAPPLLAGGSSRAEVRRLPVCRCSPRCCSRRC